MATPHVSGIDQGTVVVKRTDFESTARKLQAFIAGLAVNEKEVMGWLLERAGFAPALPLVHLKYPHGGGKHLVVGGADGILVLIGRSGFHIVPPEGPLPTDLVGTALVPPEI